MLTIHTPSPRFWHFFFYLILFGRVRFVLPPYIDYYINREKPFPAIIERIQRIINISIYSYPNLKSINEAESIKIINSKALDFINEFDQSKLRIFLYSNKLSFN